MPIVFCAFIMMAVDHVSFPAWAASKQNADYFFTNHQGKATLVKGQDKAVEYWTKNQSKISTVHKCEIVNPKVKVTFNGK